MCEIAFEYIACQQKNNGVLILSEFVGAAQTLGSGALLVNPFNTDEVSRALYEALHMPEQERVERHQYMSECVTRFSAQLLPSRMGVHLPPSSFGGMALGTVPSRSRRAHSPFFALPWWTVCSGGTTSSCSRFHSPGFSAPFMRTIL